MMLVYRFMAKKGRGALRRGLFVVGALVALSLLAACGSSAKDPTPTPVPPTATPPPSPTPTPVLVFTGDALKAYDYMKALNTISNRFVDEFTGTGTAVFTTRDQAAIARLTDRGIALAEGYLRDVTALAAPAEIADLAEVRTLAIRSAERVVALSREFKTALTGTDTAASTRIATQLVAYQSNPDIRRARELMTKTLQQYSIPPGAVGLRPGP
jgi:hypothetical protein